MLINTKVEAFHALTAVELQGKEQQVMSVFCSPGDLFTRQQLVRKVGMPINGVCGRVHALIEKRVLCVRGYHYDERTRKTQELLGIPVQGAE